MSDVTYQIYPTLLDQWQRLCDCEMLAEQFWNIDEDGNYRLTPEELAADAEAELIATINRTKVFDTTLADRGTCFNDIIDEMVEGRYCGDAEAEHRSLNGHDFTYSVELAKSVAEKLTDAVCQWKCEGVLSTRYGGVRLYGYIDYWRYNSVIDLKTTEKYDFGKYESHWQRYVYPWCLVQAGHEIDRMDFLVVKMTQPRKKCAAITGEIFTESYTHSQAMAEAKLREVCEGFIGWIEINRDKITNKKIFNEEEE